MELHKKIRDWEHEIWNIFLRKGITDDDCCRITVAALLAGKSHEAAYDELIKTGCSSKRASKCVTFMTSAFAHVFLKGRGFAFPDHYHEIKANGMVNPKPMFYHKERLFKAALNLAEEMYHAGNAEEVEAIAKLSAEYAIYIEESAKGHTHFQAQGTFYRFY